MNLTLTTLRSLTTVPNGQKDYIQEAWYSIREPNAINEQIYIPDIYMYKALGNPKWSISGSFKALICICKPFMLKKVIVL